MIAVKFIIVAVISYLLGSLNFGVILSRKLAKEDVRSHGSGNAGSTNMLRNYGKGMAAFTMAGDMLKVMIAIFIAFLIIPDADLEKEFINTAFAENSRIIVKCFAGFFCVLGHIFPCFFNFKGGKGVATSGGMVFMIDWRIALILLAMFIVVVAITKYVSLGSLIMAFFYPVLIFAFYQDVVLTLIAVVFAVVVFVAHRSNIVKLINHNESKITDKKKKDS